MSSWQMRRFLGACVALTAAILLVLSLVLPLFVGTLSARGTTLTMKITAWGFETDAPMQVGAVPVNAYPIVIVTVAAFAAAIIALVGARANASRAYRRAAGISLALATALTIGVTATVTPQVTSWLASFRSTGSVAANTDTAIGLGFWTLVAGTVLAAVATVLAALPTREAATPPYGFPMPAATPDDEPPPANVESHGTGGSA